MHMHTWRAREMHRSREMRDERDEMERDARGDRCEMREMRDAPTTIQIDAPRTEFETKLSLDVYR